MLRTGRQYLDGLQDGRIICLGAGRVADVLTHSGFRAAAETIAAVFDLKFDADCRADLVVDDGDESPYSTYFLMPQTREDLDKRRRCHQRIADATYGLMGRSPDHVASLITGLTMEATALDEPDGRVVSGAMRDYYRFARQKDAYIVYAVLPIRPASTAALVGGTNPSLRVVREDDGGVVLRGVKALATAAMFADEIWIGNLQPIGNNGHMEAITCAVPCNAPGLQLWSRKAFAASASREFDSPLTWRFDEGDAVLVFDDVKVDWNRVFVHRDPVRSSQVYVGTPAHCLANHQSAVRSLAKARLMIGLAHRIACSNGADQSPAVREMLGRLAAIEASLEGLIDAQVATYERWPSGGVSPNRRYMYAALNMCQEVLPTLVDALRELSGAGTFKFPDSADFVSSPSLELFERFWGTRGPALDQALDQMKLFKLSWDLIGSEFAGRQQQYERFYAGPTAVVRGHNYREAKWDRLETLVTRLMETIERPQSPDTTAT